MDKDILLRRITNFLIINSTDMKSVGLIHGKMGVIIYFAHYAKYTGNEYYLNFVSLLLDELFKDLNTNTEVGFENGLSGIGWGIEYLLQNNYLKGDPFDVLEDIDLKILEFNFDNIVDKSFNTGIDGFLCYLKYHLNRNNLENLICHKSYLKDLIRLVDQYNVNVCFDLSLFVESNKFDVYTEPYQWKVGLELGCTGYGLKLMLK